VVWVARRTCDSIRTRRRFCWAQITGGLEGCCLWGGAVRILILHHASLFRQTHCATFSGDAIISTAMSRATSLAVAADVGEHGTTTTCLPTSAHHRAQALAIDPGGWLMATGSRESDWSGDVVRISPAAQQAKLHPSPADVKQASASRGPAELQTSGAAQPPRNSHREIGGSWPQAVSERPP